MRWKLGCTSYPAKCMTILEIHISLRLHRPTKNLKTNPNLINSQIYWVKYHRVPSLQQDLWPVATRKGQPVKKKDHCKYNPYLCLFISPFALELFAHRYNTVYRHNVTFEMSLLFWNFCKCNVYFSFFIVYFTFVYYLFHLLCHCKHMFTMPIKPFELNWNRWEQTPPCAVTWWHMSHVISSKEASYVSSRCWTYTVIAEHRKTSSPWLSSQTVNFTVTIYSRFITAFIFLIYSETVQILCRVFIYSFKTFTWLQQAAIVTTAAPVQVCWVSILFWHVTLCVLSGLLHCCMSSIERRGPVYIMIVV